jgi:hypothetical protein
MAAQWRTQRLAIYYDNAARFLRPDPEVIAADYARSHSAEMFEKL